MSADFPYAGTGWAFPPRWVREPAGTRPEVGAGPDGADPAAGAGRVRLVTSSGAEHVREALVLVLRTALGERVMRPDFGSGVDRYVFEPRTAAVCHRLADDVRRALLLGEPRVIVDEVTAVPAGAAEDRVDVTIEYRIDRHRRPQSLILPFYLAGGAP